MVILGLGAAVKVQTDRLDTCKAAHAAFVAQVKAAGEAAEAAAKAKEAADRKTKERADATHKRELDRLHAAYVSMRDSRTSTGLVPPAGAGSRSPEVACYKRADLDRALRAFDSGVAGLLEAGDSAIAGLNTARQWASER
ncbi:MAG: hypothetical protein ACM31O_00050 [Bacteroidota bacterium]